MRWLYENGELGLFRGKVSRQNLERSLGLRTGVLRPSSKVKQYMHARRCIANFDKHLYSRGHGTVWEEMVPEIEAHLETLKKAKALPVNGYGNLNRAAILKQFVLGGFSASIAQSRAPRLKKLLDAYDTTAEDPAYTQFKYSKYEKKLKLLLKDTDLVLTHGRIVSPKWISEKLGISTSSIINTPVLNALIEDKQREIDLRCRKGVTQKYFRINGVHHINIGVTPYSDKHKRIFDFSRLVDFYGLNFSEKVATVFISLIEDMESPKPYYQRIIHFLLWLVNAPQLYGELAADLGNNKHIDQAEFERAIYQYKDAPLSRAEVDSARRGRFRPELQVVQKFADAGIFPQIRIHISKKRKGNSRHSRPRPSLVEAKQIEPDTKNIAQLIKSTATYFNIEFDRGKDTIEFGENLAREIHQREDLPKDISQAVCVLCEERLTALRISASKIFESWREQFELGRQIIDSSVQENRTDYRTLENIRLNKTKFEWTKTISPLLPKQDPDLALRNLLTLVDKDFDGVCPLANTHEWGQYWTKIYMRTGGKDRVQSFLSPPRLVTSAVICLYLCETGANESVATSMMADAIRPSKVPKHLTTVGNKVRSKGKQIIDDLPLESTITGCTSAAEAMSFYQSATSRYRSKNSEETNKLFLYVEYSKIKHMTEWQLRGDFSKITANSTELSTLKITPSMIRPTVLLMEYLKNPTNIGATQLLARHENDTTTFGYVNKLPHRVILADKIREFQERIQNIALSKNKKARDIIGIESTTWITANKRAQRTGLGLFCSDPTLGVQPDYPKGSTCQALDRCLVCPQKIVVAEPQSIADMIIWKNALESAEDRFLNERYERWETVWLQWYAFFQVVLDEKMTRGEFAKIKKDAERLAGQRMQSKDFKLQEPW